MWPLIVNSLDIILQPICFIHYFSQSSYNVITQITGWCRANYSKLYSLSSISHLLYLKGPNATLHCLPLVFWPSAWKPRQGNKGLCRPAALSSSQVFFKKKSQLVIFLLSCDLLYLGRASLAFFNVVLQPDSEKKSERACFTDKWKSLSTQPFDSSQWGYRQLSSLILSNSVWLFGHSEMKED